MSIFQSLDITASALTAQRLRMDVISSIWLMSTRLTLDWLMDNGNRIGANSL